MAGTDVSLDALLVSLTPHEPSARCENIHCFIHMVDEPGDGYLTCGECFHLFRTRRALRAAERAQLRDDWRHPWSRPTWRRRRYPATALTVSRWVRHYLTIRAGRIYSCPLCAHDF
jgi:hypothetical protein